MHHTRVAPNALHLVMAIETQYRQSLFLILNATRVTPSDPPGLRRLRFPSFKFNCQRAIPPTRIREPAQLTGSEDNEAPTGLTRAWNHEVS